MKAVWNSTILADSDRTVIVEGNHYFPEESIRREYLQSSDTHTNCHWKGEASYYHVVVNGDVNKDAAWYYVDPSEAAKEIKGRIAFWKGVQITT